MLKFVNFEYINVSWMIPLSLPAVGLIKNRSCSQGLTVFSQRDVVLS